MRALALIAALVLGGCANEDDAPVATARAFVLAARVGDMTTLMDLLERRAVSHLQLAAERASDQVGGRRNISPQEMLQIVDIDPTFQIARAERIDDGEDLTRVRLTGADETVHELELVREGDAWRVRIPLGHAQEPS